MKKSSSFLMVMATLVVLFPKQLFAQSVEYRPAGLYVDSLYLIPPDSLSATAPDDAAILTWFPPSDSCCPPSGQLPEGLLGYNIYRNDSFLSFTPHEPPGEYVWQGYVDEGISPGWYQYTITAVYDLAPYGFPGDTAESMEEGPAEITSCFCFELEFNETWALGNFEDNYWTPGSVNWSINGQEGNPAPSAEFAWDPIQENYSIALESYMITAIGMTEGQIWLDFELKLDNVQPTGEEMLNIQVWNWESQEWSMAAVYSNAEGSFGWTSEHIDITSPALGKPFKVRFLAEGANSANILSWFIDNIHIYRACDDPENLTVERVWQGAILNWDPPSSVALDEWIHWDDGVNADNSIGTGFAVEFDCAARWEPEQLSDYLGASVTEISFFPAELQAVYSIRVWIGEGAANLVVDQPVSAPLIGEWNSVTLNTPVPVDITQELWIGYHINAQVGYPAGVDDGPAIDGYGNMLNYGGWQTLLQMNPDLDFNWNIAANLIFNESSNMTGYNLYRSVEGDDYIFLDYTTETTYLDTYMVAGSLVCYRVSAVWESETDICESSFTNEDCVIIGIDSHDEDAAFSMYPNPADDHVFITTPGDLKQVTVYNALGMLVSDEIISGKKYELRAAGYTIGVYLVRIATTEGVSTRALTIQR